MFFAYFPFPLPPFVVIQLVSIHAHSHCIFSKENHLCILRRDEVVKGGKGNEVGEKSKEKNVK